MPTYEYACTSCGQHLEVHQRLTDEPLTTCAACGGALRKVFHPAGIVFKGSGFYATDNRSKKSDSSSSSTAATTPASTSSSDTSSSGSGAGSGDSSSSSSSKPAAPTSPPSTKPAPASGSSKESA